MHRWPKPSLPQSHDLCVNPFCSTDGAALWDTILTSDKEATVKISRLRWSVVGGGGLKYIHIQYLCICKIWPISQDRTLVACRVLQRAGGGGSHAFTCGRGGSPRRWDAGGRSEGPHLAQSPGAGREALGLGRLRYPAPVSTMEWPWVWAAWGWSVPGWSEHPVCRPDPPWHWWLRERQKSAHPTDWSWGAEAARLVSSFAQVCK